MAPRPREYTGREKLSQSASQIERDVPVLTATRHLIKPNGSIVGKEVAEVLKLLGYHSFLDTIPTNGTALLNDQPAVAAVDGRRPISHERVRDFITNDFRSMLQQIGARRGHRIALVLPNGPELALAIVATAEWASCVPMSANGATSELEADLMRCGADLVIAPYYGPLSDEYHAQQSNSFQVLEMDGQGWSVFGPVKESANKLGIPVVHLVPSPIEAGIFRLISVVSEGPLSWAAAKTSTMTSPILPTDGTVHTCNDWNDECLVLFTSGTTGNKKIVPHRLGDMLTAATTIALSWNLSPDDVNCNLMPLFHVGGIVRQVFSPLISGGCVICCPSFDPSVFWTLLSRQTFNWYYAAPSIHQILLQTHDPEECPNPKLMMIANAAGGLLPSLAVQMRDRFGGANILPSYGMTECMPISSPPFDYKLDKPGTSGVPVGPEVAILNLQTMEPLKAGKEGPICVRGEPCFQGYGAIGCDRDARVPDTFLADGWFNTGDLGHLDADGYLFITGRSKEVINRGGEIISPMEVEEAVMGHPVIQACAAFSAPHDVLQEVVGIVVVMKADARRIDLPQLHEFLAEQLAQPKWPQCLVFMDGLPKSHTNKLLRVKLGSRLGVPEINESMAAIERTFEGKCPPQGTPLDVPISVENVKISATDVESKLSGLFPHAKILVRSSGQKSGALVCYAADQHRKDLVLTAMETLDRYEVPSHFVDITQLQGSLSSYLPVPTMHDTIASILCSRQSEGDENDPVSKEIKQMISSLLNLESIPTSDNNFFHTGGSSMSASQLASKIRKQFGISCSGAEIFHHQTVRELSQMVRERTKDDTTATETSSLGYQDKQSSTATGGAPFPSKRLPIQASWFGSFLQLLPLYIIFPAWQVSRYLLFFAVMLRSFELVPGPDDIVRFLMALLAFHLVWVTVTPLIFVAIKWIVIGKYQSGRFPIYGSYYLRWWFVDQCRKLFLRGIWGSHEVLLNFYYRLLGAKIGKGARISLECEIAEYDLVTIGDHAAIEQATVRGFGVDNGAMILGPVAVGHGSSVGARSVVAPFTSIEDDCHLGAVTSSYDAAALDPRNARTNRRLISEPNLRYAVLVEGTISFAVNCFSQVPPLLVLLTMLWYKSGSETFDSPSDLLSWLSDPHRIPFYIGIRVARALLSPFFYMAAAIAVKKLVIGRFEAGPLDTTSQWQLTRHHLAATLFSRKKMQACTDLMGRHYECVSILYRLLGAKVGKRVFWPGHQPVFTGQFDLLEIGDDVVFGSRSMISCITVDACKPVTLCAGSNVADNCVVFPGTILGKNAVLGSNSICGEGSYLPANSIWLGSKGSQPMCLEKGSDPVAASTSVPLSSTLVNRNALPLQGDDTTLRPFGKAFYLRQANYFVWPLHWIVAGTWVLRIGIAIFHTLPLLGAIHGAATILYGWPWQTRDYLHTDFSFLTLYESALCSIWILQFWYVAAWLLVELTAKWSLLGRRQVGHYNYDTCDYAQRWEGYQLIAKIRKVSRYNLLQFLWGTPWANHYFRWNGGHVGKDCCLYPTGADPFMPEPDLVKMGDRCVIDCASIVCHLNTQGNFTLREITLEEECTMRTRSRIQQGVYLERGSQILEKSLVLTGEIVEAHSVWQGGPASSWFTYSTVEDKRDDIEKDLESQQTFSSNTSAASDDHENDQHDDERTKLLSGDSDSPRFFKHYS